MDVEYLKTTMTDTLVDGDVVENKDRGNGSMHEISSAVAYLVGAPVRAFEVSHEPLMHSVFDELEKNKAARIIRHLCSIRTDIERGFKRLNEAMRYEYKALPPLLDKDDVNQLADDRVDWYKSKEDLQSQIISINSLICNRINNCKDIFPTWINWEYVKDLFIVPKGNTVEGITEECRVYYSNMDLYPYKCFLHWKPVECKNLFHSDESFVRVLYAQHDDVFSDLSKVKNAKESDHARIRNFLENVSHAKMIVDCENADPFYLYGVLNNVPELEKLDGIILVNDKHASSAWCSISRFTPIPIEMIEIERIVEEKSLADVIVTSRICQEHYKNDVDAFILVSSDSDFWGVMTTLKDVSFFSFLIRENTSSKFVSALSEHDVPYTFLDLFHTGNIEDFRGYVIKEEIQNYLESLGSINIYDMFAKAKMATCIDMAPDECDRFLSKHLRNMSLKIDKDGNVTFDIH